MKSRELSMVLRLALVAIALFWGVGQYRAQSQAPSPQTRMTPAQRWAAAARAATARAAAAAQTQKTGTAPQQTFGAQDVPPTPNGAALYFGVYPNYANSPLPTVDPNTQVITGGIRKFVDTLPGLGPANANNLGNYIPIANQVKNPNGTDKYPGSDYYEIGEVNYTQRFHSDLPNTTQLRGYIDLSPAADGMAHYLGPVIVAQKDRPVRLKFTNKLPLSNQLGSNLPIPMDNSVMGTGACPQGGNYTQNRAVIHLHGGATPWISDGTPHQWIVPAGDPATCKTGVSFQNVPDMPDPGQGSATQFYTNQQTARLMFYHDHAYGTTRLNVYDGVAAGYLVTDPTEENLLSVQKVIPDLGGVYHWGIPLVIQDKTFVPPPAQLAAEDPTWDTANWGGMGNLWFPHVTCRTRTPLIPRGQPLWAGGTTDRGFGRRLRPLLVWYTERSRAPPWLTRPKCAPGRPTHL